MQIVNVDDDPDDREMFCRAITKIDPDIACIQIESGEEAVEVLSKSDFSPEFIFMDINMPRMNGYECVREIYQCANLRDTTIVMFSSSFNPRDQVDFGVMGLKYLLKTSNLSALGESIKKMIQSKLLVEKQKT
jgi:DNA-binding response OmpR family regulator